MKKATTLIIISFLMGACGEINRPEEAETGSGIERTEVMEELYGEWELVELEISECEEELPEFPETLNFDFVRNEPIVLSNGNTFKDWQRLFDPETYMIDYHQLVATLLRGSSSNLRHVIRFFYSNENVNFEYLSNVNFAFAVGNGRLEILEKENCGRIIYEGR